MNAIDIWTPEDHPNLRFSIEPDLDTTINDFDGYGRFAPVERSRDYVHDRPRPEGFTGRAMKLDLRSDRIWWEPFEGYEDLTPDQQRDEKWRVRELIEFGFHLIRLEIVEGEDAYGRPIVKDWTVLGAVDLSDRDEIEKLYLDDMLADLKEDA